MRFRVLGPIEVESDDGNLLDVGGSRQRAVLALLIAYSGTVRSVDQIADGVWGDDLPANPKGTVQVAVSRLRKELGADRILSRGPGYVLRVEADELDADVLDRLLVEGRHAADARRHRLAIERFDQALSMWRGDPYADFSYADFSQSEISRLQASYDNAVEARIESLIADGEHAAALSDLEALLAADPLREGLWASYMLALYRDGRQADALRAYQEAARTLGEELGIEPGHELRELEEQIVLQSPELDHDAGRTEIDLPEGEVTMVVADAAAAVEADPTGAESMLEQLDSVVADRGGHLFRSTADQRFVVFDETPPAIATAIAFNELDLPNPISFAVHVTEARPVAGDYVGLGVSRTARVAAVAVPGEVLVTETAAAALGASAALETIESRVLPGTSRPEALWRVRHPAIRVVDEAAVARVGNLPATELSSFIGRAAELADLRDLLEKERLLTLTGPGGVGKTRLGLQAAADQVGRYPDGVWLISLASLDDGDRLASTVAATMGLELDPEQDPTAAVAAQLRGRSALLVMDTCEHLLEAVTANAAGILEASPRSAVLATSRERLGIPGEAVYQVPRLPVPEIAPALEPAQVLEFEAVSLFSDRAQDIDAGFEVTEANAEAVATLCRRLDGIPLAIELAAGRIDVLSPAEMVDRLDQRFALGSTGRPRGRTETLRDAIGWSYNLLSADERTLLDRLSVFASPCDLTAVEAIAFADGIDGDPLELTASLVAKSLVEARRTHDGPTQFELLETIRAFAAENLEATSGAESIAGSHAQYFAQDAFDQSELLQGPDAEAVISQMTDRLPDFRLALAWVIDHDLDLALRLLGEVSLFWYWTGRSPEGLTWAERTLRNADTTPTAALGLALKTAGGMALMSAHYGRSRELLEQAIAVSSEVGDRLGEFRSRTNLAILDGDEGRFEEAAAGFKQAMGVLPEDADPNARLDAALNVGAGNFQIGKYGEALAAFRQVSAIAEASEDQQSMATAIVNIGACELMAGNVSSAQTALRRSLDLSSKLDQMLAAQALTWLSCAELVAGDISPAAATCCDALKTSMDAYVANARESLFVAGTILAARQAHDDALRLLGAAQGTTEQRLNPAKAELLAEFVAKARAGAGDADDTYSEGQTMALEAAVALAIDSLETIATAD